jgi:uncharacterized lipoprotein NlpE involved in copper resistance
MRKDPLALGALATLTLMLLVGCTNALEQIDGSTTVDCSVKEPDGGLLSCVINTNVLTSEETTVQNECTGNKGTLVGSCPTSGLVGCCTETNAGVTSEACYYAGVESELKSNCGSGTWTTSQ